MQRLSSRSFVQEHLLKGPPLVSPNPTIRAPLPVHLPTQLVPSALGDERLHLIPVQSSSSTLLVWLCSLLLTLKHSGQWHPAGPAWPAWRARPELPQPHRPQHQPAREGEAGRGESRAARLMGPSRRMAKGLRCPKQFLRCVLPAKFPTPLLFPLGLWMK